MQASCYEFKTANTFISLQIKMMSFFVKNKSLVLQLPLSSSLDILLSGFIDLPRSMIASCYHSHHPFLKSSQKCNFSFDRMPTKAEQRVLYFEFFFHFTSQIVLLFPCASIDGAASNFPTTLCHGRDSNLCQLESCFSLRDLWKDALLTKLL